MCCSLAFDALTREFYQSAPETPSKKANNPNNSLNIDESMPTVLLFLSNHIIRRRYAISWLRQTDRVCSSQALHLCFTFFFFENRQAVSDKVIRCPWRAPEKHKYLRPSFLVRRNKKKRNPCCFAPSRGANSNTFCSRLFFFTRAPRSSPPKAAIATLVSSLRLASEINLAGAVRDGDRAENYGLLFDFEPCDYLLRQSNIKPPNWICRETDSNI